MTPPLEQYDTVRARFEPRRRDDLRDGAADVIGRDADWQAGWVIEDGQFAGQWAMMALDRAFPFAWVPQEDLATDADG